MDEEIAFGESGRYRRLILMIGGIGLWCLIGKLILDYLLDYGFTFPDLSRAQVYERIVKSLTNGLWIGFWLGFPMWLARENFKKRGKKERKAVAKSQDKT